MRAAILFLIARAACAQFASIEGIALNTVTQQPMPGVHLLMMSIDIESGRAMPGAAYGAMSKADGSFSIMNVAPGGYILVPQRAGFVHTPGEKTAGLTLKPGEHLSGYTLPMTPRATIAGRVLDELGEPVPGIQVEVKPVGSEQPLLRTMNARTNERGEYKLSGAPGKYLVKANQRQVLASSGVAEIRLDGSVAVTYGPSQTATPVEVGPGQDVNGIDIRLVPQRTMTIRGIVSGLPATGAQRAVVALLNTDNLPQFGGSQYTSSDLKGQFVFTSVQPGAYRCFARVDGKPPMFSQLTDLRMEAGDQNITLKISSGDDISGTVDRAGASAEKLTVHLEPTTALDRSLLGVGAEAEVGADGAFRISGVFPGKLRVRVEPLPENAYVKSVKVDNADAPNAVLDFSRGVTAARLRVTLSPNGAEISGQLLDKAGLPLQSPLARVYVASHADDVGWYFEDNVNAVARGGKYSVRGIRPGKYHVLAFDGLRTSGSPDQMNPLFEAAEIIEFKENDRIVKDLKAATPGGANAK